MNNSGPVVSAEWFVLGDQDVLETTQKLIALIHENMSPPTSSAA